MKAFIQVSTSIVLASAFAFSSAAKASAVQGTASQKWVWSEEQGFISIFTCVESQVDDSGLRVSEIPGKPRALVSAKTGDKKNDQVKSATDLSDYVVEVTRNSKEKNLPNHSGLVRGSFWQASMDGSKYEVVNCEEGPKKTKYVMFDVFVAGESDAVAHVGVSASQLGVLSVSKVLTVKEVGEEITNSSQTKTAQVAPVEKAQVTAPTVKSSKVVLTPKSSVAVAKPSTPEAKSAAVVAVGSSSKDAKPVVLVNASEKNPSKNPEKSPVVSQVAPKSATTQKPVAVQYVVCVKEGAVQIRDPKLKESLFTAKNMDAIDSLKMIKPKKQEKMIDGKKTTFVEVVFPGNPKGKNTGWIAESFLSPKALCSTNSVPVKAAATPAPTPAPAPAKTQVRTEAKPDATEVSEDKLDILAPNCAEEKLLSAAKVAVRQNWGNRPRSGGKCAKGVRLSLQFSKIGDPPVTDGLGDAIDFVQNLKSHGFVDSGIRDVRKAPAGAVIILGGPYTAEYLSTHHRRHGGGNGNYVGHVTIKGNDGFFYTDAKEDHVAIGWVGTTNRSKIRNIWAIYVPGPALIKKYAGQCSSN
jgi:hypothetical protein